MKITCRIASTVLLVLGGFAGCVSTRIVLPDDPYTVVAYLAIVKTVGDDLEALPVLENDDVSQSDSRIFAVVKVLAQEKRSLLRWKWYNPDGDLVKQSDPVVVNDGARYLEYFIAWDSLEKTYYEARTGTWTVVITLDEVFLIRREFMIH